MIERMLILAFSLVAVAACGNGTGDAATAQGAAATNAPAPAAEPAPADSELSGTEWRLVRIMEMDDSTHVPDDAANYTLAFVPDGSVSIRADCNRGSGTWSSQAANQLRFGPIAATQALCPPESIGEVYLTQFQWVRSYTMNDGHLFLATMADGSIIEFEPAAGLPPVAIVLGEKLYTTDPAELQEAILTPLFEHYAAEQEIEVLEGEIDHYVETLEAGMREMGLDAGADLTADEKAEVEVMRREMGRSLILRWKINRALYEQYDGRIIYQQFGPEPLDAYRKFLEEQCEADALAIMDPELEAGFWRYFTDESMHDFMAPGSADAARAFSLPPWERQPSD